MKQVCIKIVFILLTTLVLNDQCKGANSDSDSDNTKDNRYGRHEKIAHTPQNIITKSSIHSKTYYSPDLTSPLGKMYLSKNDNDVDYVDNNYNKHYRSSKIATKTSYADDNNTKLRSDEIKMDVINTPIKTSESIKQKKERLSHSAGYIEHTDEYAWENKTIENRKSSTPGFSRKRKRVTLLNETTELDNNNTSSSFLKITNDEDENTSLQTAIEYFANTLKETTELNNDNTSSSASRTTNNEDENMNLQNAIEYIANQLMECEINLKAFNDLKAEQARDKDDLTQKQENEKLNLHKENSKPKKVAENKIEKNYANKKNELGKKHKSELENLEKKYATLIINQTKEEKDSSLKILIKKLKTDPALKRSINIIKSKPVTMWSTSICRLVRSNRHSCLIPTDDIIQIMVNITENRCAQKSLTAITLNDDLITLSLKIAEDSKHNRVDTIEPTISLTIKRSRYAINKDADDKYKAQALLEWREEINQPPSYTNYSFNKAAVSMMHFLELVKFFLQRSNADQEITCRELKDTCTMQLAEKNKSLRFVRVSKKPKSTGPGDNSRADRNVKVGLPIANFEFLDKAKLRKNAHLVLHDISDYDTFCTELPNVIKQLNEANITDSERTTNQSSTEVIIQQINTDDDSKMIIDNVDNDATEIDDNTFTGLYLQSEK